MRNIDENELLRDAMKGLSDEVPPMPEGLHAAWMSRVAEEAVITNQPVTSQPAKKFNPRTVTRYLSLAAAMVFVVGGTLISRGSLMGSTDKSVNQLRAGGAVNGASYAYGASYMADTDGGYVSYSMNYDETVEEEAASPMLARSMTPGSEPEAPAEVEKKIIRTASLTLVSRTFDESYAALRASCENQGGWIESSSESTDSHSGLRSAYLTLRIPQSALDGYLSGVDALGRVTSRSESAKDVTESYQDTQSRLETQKALMARLQSLITESADLTDLLALESQIADTQYEIDRLQSSLNATDRKVAYSTVNITLREESNASLTDATVTLGERIRSALATGWEAFTGFLADMVVFLMAALPFIGIAAAVWIAAHFIRKVRRK